jgi:hypothetical protein
MLTGRVPSDIYDRFDGQDIHAQDGLPRMHAKRCPAVGAHVVNWLSAEEGKVAWHRNIVRHHRGNGKPRTARGSFPVPTLSSRRETPPLEADFRPSCTSAISGLQQFLVLDPGDTTRLVLKLCGEDIHLPRCTSIPRAKQERPWLIKVSNSKRHAM